MSEREVPHWLRLGKTNAEIAELMAMSESTIKHYLIRLFDQRPSEVQSVIAAYWQPA